MNDEIKQKSGFWKFSLKFIAIIILALAAGWGFARYQQYLGEKGVERLAEGLKQWEKDEYARAMADTYGGKTPQETLQMYIDAVEKGDYELASKYFIEDKREEWKNNLKKISESGKVADFITPIKTGLESEGEYSDDKKRFFITEPVDIDFGLYPNGIWKIMQI